jgi:hypothetical protein
MTYDKKNQQNLDIDPAMIIIGLGYATCLCLTIGWLAMAVI